MVKSIFEDISKLGVTALTAGLASCAFTPPSPDNQDIGLNGLILYAPPAHLNAAARNPNISFTGLGGVSSYATPSGWNCFNGSEQNKDRDIYFFNISHKGNVSIKERRDDFASP